MLNATKPRPTPHPRIRVLVIDDSVVIRKILSDALRNDPEIEVIGTASNGLIALQRIAQLSPDIVTLDIEMPEMDGIATLREIKRQFPRTRVIMCSTLTERGASITIEALSLGADDYLTKSSGQHGVNAMENLHGQLIPKVKQFFHRETGPGASRPAPRPTGFRDFASGPVLARPAAPRASASAVPRTRQSPPRAVAIGVSTGGPNALAEVIPMLPRDFPLPVFVVQHMPPMFTRLLAERLQSQSKVKVVEAQEGMRATPGHVYIAPGDYHMVVSKSAGSILIHLNQGPMENSCRPAVDVLFRSVGEVYGGATVSAILTGMGQDGLRGVEQLRALGGYVIAQDEASSVVWGMPGFVARAGLADIVCDLKQVTPEIVRQL
jgi:two-component system, chemotaxis family, protein-glutamate methylesterase/glutaminase